MRQIDVIALSLFDFFVIDRKKSSSEILFEVRDDLILKQRRVSVGE